MAAPTDIELIRQLADVDEEDFDDEFIEELIEQSGSDYGAVSLLWKIKAAGYARKVSVSSGSVRIDIVDRYRNALEMSLMYENLAGGLDNDERMTSVTMAPAYGDDDSTEYTWGPGSWPAEGIWASWERQT